MTGIRLQIISNVCGSGGHSLLYDSQQEQLEFQLLHKLPVDVFGQHFRIAPAGNAWHFEL